MEPRSGAPQMVLGQPVEEAGTAPEDRRFRPDVEGLRAVAVAAVVLYHAGIGHLSGGFVGVDVFFVISGFVITGVLLRERATSHQTSIAAFYARRARRILPAATLVLIVTVAVTYAAVGVVVGSSTAVDAKWTAVFLSNFHFAAQGANYFSSSQPPSPLQNFWSLAVEEQFYVLYPTIFLAVASIRIRMSLRARLTVCLTGIILLSFAWSVIQTSNSPNWAYFSPLTRAWELALGALVAVSTPWLRRVPTRVATVATWFGLAAVLVSAFTLNAHSPYPGSLAAIPVLGTALVIAGGTAAPRHGAEWLLAFLPIRLLGRVSYSLYLWHWPILIIAAESVGKTTLSPVQNGGWLVVSLVLAIITYVAVENPVRRNKFLLPRPWASIGVGALLIAVTLAAMALPLSPGAGGITTATRKAQPPLVAAATESSVASLVAAATGIQSVPADLTPSLSHLTIGFPPDRCVPDANQSTVPRCEFGDPHGTHTMVLYGDSHAGMWFQALDDVAIQTHWKLYYLGKDACPVDVLPFTNPPGDGKPAGRFTACDRWHGFATRRIDQIDPDLIVVTQEADRRPGQLAFSASQWGTGLRKAILAFTALKARTVVLGNVPILPQSGPDCLARHPSDVPACSSPRSVSAASFRSAERLAAQSLGDRYVDTTSWFCSDTCTAVIGKYDVYSDDRHISAAYSHYLEGVLAQSLGLSPGT